MVFVDEHWNQMLHTAVAFQQNLYGLLPDWSVYNDLSYKNLKQNIGFAMYGMPPSGKTVTSNITTVANNKDISDLVEYPPQAKELINEIFEKILTYGKRDSAVKCGIIYNIIFRCKMNEPLEGHEKEEVIAVPIFKVQRENQHTYITWFIDIKGRVYQSWEDFILNNNYPQCTMVFPKDGYYQPNPEFPILPHYSIVWLIAKDSYACSNYAINMKIADTVVNTIAGATAVTLGAVSIFTPAGPIMASIGASVMVGSGIWTIGKCSQDLYDKSIHYESISPLNRSALSAWLGIAGCTIGIAVTGGGMLLERSIVKGIQIGSVAKGMYNTAVVMNISVNLLALGLHGYQCYEKYQKEGRIDVQDIIYFGTRALFFVNAIVSAKFANNIIEATQGKVLGKLEENLREENLQKQYEFIQSKAACDYGTSKTARDAAVTRYVNDVEGNNTSETWNTISNWHSNIVSSLLNISYVNDNLAFFGITIMDPIKFIAKIGINYVNRMVEASSEDGYSVDTVQLMEILRTLLSNFVRDNEGSYTELPETSEFRSLIQEIRNVHESENILRFIFRTAVAILKDNNQLKYLVEACRFVWDYVKENLLEKFGTLSIGYWNYSKFFTHMRYIFLAILEALDSMVHKFFNAVQQYIRITRRPMLACSS